MSSSPDPPQPEAGVVISGTVGSVSGDIVGRDKITHGLSAEQLVAVLEARGLIQPAEAAGLQDDPLLRLAGRIECHAYWDDLVLPINVHHELREIVDRSRADPRGTAMKGDREIQALFHGPRGTGKRLAAQVIGHELRLDEYAINYTAVVEHHALDTTRRLQQLIATISMKNSLLIVHDAEIIFGANSSAAVAGMVELQGNLIFTTTKLSEIDRRLLDKVGHVVNFPFPDATNREHIWRRAIRPEVPLVGDIDFQRLARRYALSGENIRRAVEQAASDAVREDRPVALADLESAAARLLNGQARLERN
jgi:SpoVK/Ycf46/Vps4 family AAA+-type ATPase